MKVYCENERKVNGNCVKVLLIKLTYLLTPRSTVLLEKLTSSQLVKKFRTFYITRWFITALRIAQQLSGF